VEDEPLRTEAYLSRDRRYRYWLLRAWDDALPLLCVIGLNPSTADEQEDDPTIRKTIGFARRLGYGGVLMLNVGAYRATDPREWKQAADPFGRENTVAHLKGTIERFRPACIVAAWGRNCAAHRGLLRAHEIMRQIPDLQCWGRNLDRTPRHPLMLAYTTPLEPLLKALHADGSDSARSVSFSAERSQSRG
jgi:hypothetical protein